MCCLLHQSSRECPSGSLSASSHKQPWSEKEGLLGDLSEACRALALPHM